MRNQLWELYSFFHPYNIFITYNYVTIVSQSKMVVNSDKMFLRQYQIDFNCIGMILPFFLFWTVEDAGPYNFRVTMPEPVAFARR